MNKPRILFNTEASYSLSGFGTYTREVLKRLHQTNKYELAEFASFGVLGHPESKNIPWRWYANMVQPEDHRVQRYNSDRSNAFGKWRFESVLLHFKPDIVWNIRDYWMLAYETESPLRPYYHSTWMPTVDSAPQIEEWIENFIGIDGVFTYTDWAQNVLEKEGGGRIKLCGIASPGVDLNLFKPLTNKKEIRQQLGIPAEHNILGTVMRNQKRKLYPDLFIAFRKFLDLCHESNNQELAKKTYLYLHTSYPDFGWNLPLLLKECGIAHKVYCTYICRNCGRHFAAIFQDARTTCRFCNTPSAVMPTVSFGLTYENMGKMMGCFDGYIQYAMATGIEMPLVEASACGIPVMAIDYSGQVDVIKKTNGTPLKVERFFRELETGAYRAYPDTSYTAEQIYKFFTLPETTRKQKEKLAREGAEKHYNWDNTARIWEKYFDNVKLTGKQGKWNSPFSPIQPVQLTPQIMQLDNMRFVHWLLADVLQQPEKINSFTAMRMLRDLNYGAEIVNGQPVKLTKEDLYKRVIQKVQNHNICEEIRCGMRPLIKEDYIEYVEKNY